MIASHPSETPETPAGPGELDAATVARIQSRLTELTTGALSKRALTAPEIRSLATELLRLTESGPTGKEGSD